MKSNKGGGGCPIKGSNNMPATPQQTKAPGQTTNLDTKREASTIPQKGGQNTWQYPSPQMFWNALVRKDKADGADETDMDTVVAVHNTMNEATWSKILEWEKLREGPPPARRRHGPPRHAEGLRVASPRPEAPHSVRAALVRALLVQKGLLGVVPPSAPAGRAADERPARARHGLALLLVSRLLSI